MSHYVICMPETSFTNLTILLLSQAYPTTIRLKSWTKKFLWFSSLNWKPKAAAIKCARRKNPRSANSWTHSSNESIWPLSCRILREVFSSLVFSSAHGRKRKEIIQLNNIPDIKIVHWKSFTKSYAWAIKSTDDDHFFFRFLYWSDEWGRFLVWRKRFCWKFRLVNSDQLGLRLFWWWKQRKLSKKVMTMTLNTN